MITEGGYASFDFQRGGLHYTTAVRFVVSDTGDVLDGRGGEQQVAVGAYPVATEDDTAWSLTRTVTLTLLPRGAYQIDPSRASATVKVKDDGDPRFKPVSPAR